jgi:hypothetical protein
MKFDKGCEIIWKDKKRYCGLPWSFTRYYIVKKEGEWLKIFTDIGFLNSKVEEVNLYRCLDITMRATFFERIFGTGSIYLKTNDASCPNLAIKSIKIPYKVRDLLSSLIEMERKKKKVGITEFQ